MLYLFTAMAMSCTVYHHHGFIFITQMALSDVHWAVQTIYAFGLSTTVIIDLASTYDALLSLIIVSTTITTYLLHYCCYRFTQCQHLRHSLRFYE